MTSLGLFLCMAQVATAATAAPGTPATAAAPAPPSPSPPPPPPPILGSPFRLGLTYTRVLSESGDLTNNALGTNAIGLLFTSPSSSYVRNHFAIAYQWESTGAYSARGFRVDLVSFGYPIHLVTSEVRLDIEPVVTAVRGEIMFVNGGAGGRFLRLESGVGLEVSATYRHWFLSVQPLGIDFRYWFYGSNQFQPQSRTGLGQIFPMRLVAGHEF